MGGCQYRAWLAPLGTRSTNASFYVIIKLISSLESSDQTFNRDIQEELFLHKIVIDEKKDEVLTAS